MKNKKQNRYAEINLIREQLCLAQGILYDTLKGKKKAVSNNDKKILHIYAVITSEVALLTTKMKRDSKT